MKKKTNKMRLYHRYLGFFLAGIMAVYSISGIVLIFRNTDFLKKENTYQQIIPENISDDMLGEYLKIKNFKITNSENDLVYFEQGVYNKSTRQANYTLKELPFLMNKMTKLHKATTSSPLFYLNIFFGLSLLFFVVSAFWMYLPSTDLFKKGIYFAIGGVILTILLLFL